HKAILKPRFDLVEQKFSQELSACGFAKWSKPNGGYFVSIDVLPGTAKAVVKMCADIGLVLTSAGATYPLGIDPQDSNIRIAPTFPPAEELSVALDVFCVCARLCAVEKLLESAE
ncbi:MAG: aminotransferase, partial [Ruminococcus sp.]